MQGTQGRRFYDFLAKSDLEVVDGRVVQKDIAQNKAVAIEIKLAISDSDTQRLRDAHVNSSSSSHPNYARTANVDKVVWVRGGVGDLDPDAYRAIVDDVIARKYGTEAGFSDKDRNIIRGQLMATFEANQSTPNIKPYYFKIKLDQLQALWSGKAPRHSAN